MKKITFVLTILIPIIFGLESTIAQQSPIFSQYDLNAYYVNPAVAGCYGYTSYVLMYREQWIGVPKSPSTFMISGETRVLNNSFIQKTLSPRKKYSRRTKSGRVGLGFNIYNDQSGPISQTGIEGTYAYHIRMQETQLSFGLTLKAFQYKFDKSEIQLEGPDKTHEWDPVVDDNDLKAWVFPEANIGVYFSGQDYYAGLSANDLSQSLVELGDGSQKFVKIKRSYNILGGYTYYFSKQFGIQPSTLIRIYETPYVQLDVKLKAIYRDSYWGSFAYRTSGGGVAGWLILGLGFKYEKFYFGYSFDYTLGNIMKYSFGSHEIVAAIKLGDNARRYKWLNRY